MIKLKVIQLLFNEIKAESRLYKYYIKNIVWEMLRDSCDISRVNCSAWIEPLQKPSKEKGIMYKCIHVFTNLETKKVMFKTSCIINPNKNNLTLTFKNLETKEKIFIDILALNENHKYLEDIKKDYLRDKKYINYSNSPIKYTSVSQDNVDEYYKETALNSLYGGVN